jgi:hypothetical protein
VLPLFQTAGATLGYGVFVPSALNRQLRSPSTLQPKRSQHRLKQLMIGAVAAQMTGGLLMTLEALLTLHWKTYLRNETMCSLQQLLYNRKRWCCQHLLTTNSKDSCPYT